MTDAEARVLIAKEVRADAQTIAASIPEVDADRIAAALVNLSNRIIDRYIAHLFTDNHPRPTGVPN